MIEEICYLLIVCKLLKLAQIVNGQMSSFLKCHSMPKATKR